MGHRGIIGDCEFSELCQIEFSELNLVNFAGRLCDSAKISGERILMNCFLFWFYCTLICPHKTNGLCVSEIRQAHLSTRQCDLHTKREA